MASTTDISLDDKYRLDGGSALVGGRQVLVRLPLVQRELDRRRGLNTAGLISGYRGSPLGGYDMELWKAAATLNANDIIFQPGLNEDLALTAPAGSQQIDFLPGRKVDGVFGIWYGKGPGIDRSGDAIKHANLQGVSANGGLLIVFGDDHIGKSSTTAGRLATIDERPTAEAPLTSQDFIARRTADLSLYWNEAYARRYADLMAVVQGSAERIEGGEAFVGAVARSAYKLMAYKDEYEVARLYSDGRFRQVLNREFERTRTVRIHLAPPLLARIDPLTGRPRKMTFGAWILPVFRAMAAMKGLREGPLDVFA